MAIGDKKSAVMQSDIVNDFTTGGSTNVLSAEMGKTLAQRPNPNLLENWYFGNPIDQRGGYIVPSGTQIYADSALTDTSPGVTEAWRNVEYVNSTYCIYRGTMGHSIYYVKTSDAVRGYTGMGYGIDRWQSNGPSITVKVEDGEIQVIDNMTDWSGIEQLFENWKDFAGKTVTLSALGYTVGVGHTLHLQYGDNTSIAQNTFSKDTLGLVSFTVKVPDSIDSKFRIRTVRNGSVSGDSTLHLKAAKLELGDKQTLAHQDKNGNWVLNEIPNYGEQLRRCQYYFRRIKPGLYGSFGEGYTFATTDGFCYFTVPYEEMRTIPIVSISSYANFGVAFGGATIEISDYAYGYNIIAKTSAHLSFELQSGNGTSKPCSLIDNTGNAYIDISADL